MTNSTSHALLSKAIGAPLNCSKIFEAEPQMLLITASMVAPMEEDGVPMGMPPLPPPPAATPSVTDLLRAHRAMSEWKIVSSTHLLAQCHDTGCNFCTQYIVHLACRGNAGELSSWPPRLEQALDEAWPEEMVQIREDARKRGQPSAPKLRRCTASSTSMTLRWPLPSRITPDLAKNMMRKCPTENTSRTNSSV